MIYHLFYNQTHPPPLFCPGIRDTKNKLPSIDNDLTEFVALVISNYIITTSKNSNQTLQFIKQKELFAT